MMIIAYVYGVFIIIRLKMWLSCKYKTATFCFCKSLFAFLAVTCPLNDSLMTIQ